MSIFIIAEQEAEGLFWIETGNPETRLATLLTETKKNLRLVACWDHPGGSVGSDFMLATILPLIPRELGRKFADGAWAGNLDAVLKIATDLHDALENGLPRPEMSTVCHQIRERIGCQAVFFAKIVGKHKSLVTRWEQGVSEPGLDDILRIRLFCKAAKIDLPDELMFGEQLTITKPKRRK